MTARAQAIIIAVAIVVVSGLVVFGALVGAAVVGYKSAIRAGHEAATIQNIKTIGAVEARYFISHNRTFGTFDQLIKEESLSSKFAGQPPVADGYVFTLSVVPKPDGASWFKLNVDPVYADSGLNHFYLDSTDERIRVNRDRQAGPTDPSDKSTLN